ncbi:cell division protein FtsB [beta proteobacterium MWH-UniP1]
MAQSASLLSKLPKPNLTKILLGALILLQFPLWFGQGGWIRVWTLESQIDSKQKENDKRRLRVAELEAEVRDFKKSSRAAEERARYELGLVMPGERFLQWATPPQPSGANNNAKTNAGANANAPAPADTKGQ